MDCVQFKRSRDSTACASNLKARPCDQSEQAERAPKQSSSRQRPPAGGLSQTRPTAIRPGARAPTLKDWNSDRQTQFGGPARFVRIKFKPVSFHSDRYEWDNDADYEHLFD